MSIRKRLAKLESRPARDTDPVSALHIIADNDDPAPTPGAALLRTDGAVETWRLPDGEVLRVRAI